MDGSMDDGLEGLLGRLVSCFFGFASVSYEVLEIYRSSLLGNSRFLFFSRSIDSHAFALLVVFLLLIFYFCFLY